MLNALEANWRLIQSDYPSDSSIIAGFTVQEFGAIGDGVADETAAFQKALNAMAAAGGGTVFAPEGQYRFAGSLVIPRSVTLRGEWKAPTNQDRSVAGTILMPTAGKGNADGRAFIQLGGSTGIRDLSIWYPEQNASKPIPYPFTLEQLRGNNATFKNLTLVNPYLGIKIGPDFNELHYVHHVYGSPLKTGIRYDSTTDIGRLESVDFSPFYWVQSGLFEAPEADVLREWLRGHATGIHMLRSDWEYVDDVRVEGYQVGFKCTQGDRGSANAQFRQLKLIDCRTALYVEETNPYGMVFTDCRLEGSEYAIHLSKDFDSVVLFSNCVLRSEKLAVRSDGLGVLLMGQSKIESGQVSLDRGSLSMVASKILDPTARIQIGPNVTSVLLAGNEFVAGKQTIVNRAKPSVVQMSDAAIPLKVLPKYPDSFARVCRPGGELLQVMLPVESGNDALRIQAALDELHCKGGGTLFLGPGDYRIKGSLLVPSGVELRGIHDVPHHTGGGGSILHVYPSNQCASVIMQANSGLRGLSFNYPEQNVEAVIAYPVLIQGQGKGIYLINVNAANPYKLLDLMSHKCDEHYVDYLSGAPLKAGVMIGGGSINGIVRNVQFNPHYWTRAPEKNPYFTNKTFGGVMIRGTGKILWEYQKENLDALVVADTENQFLYQNFVFGSLYGIRFTEQNGKGPRDLISHGHGTDGAKVGVYFEHGEEQISMVNSELVAMSSADKIGIKLGSDFNGKVTFLNTMIWGEPDLVMDVESGELALMNLHAHHHGAGMRIGDAKLEGSNLNFFQPRPYRINAERGSELNLKAVISRSPVRLQGDGSLNLVSAPVR